MLWANNGQLACWWQQYGVTVGLSGPYGPFSSWTPKTIAVGIDKVARVVWQNTGGQVSIWNLQSDLPKRLQDAQLRPDRWMALPRPENRARRSTRSSLGQLG